MLFIYPIIIIIGWINTPLFALVALVTFRRTISLVIIPVRVKYNFFSHTLLTFVKKIINIIYYLQMNHKEINIIQDNLPETDVFQKNSTQSI